MSETFDTPSGDDVFQEDDATIPAIPVEVQGTVQVDEMPARMGAARNVLCAAGADPVQLITGNPRRKRLLVWHTFFGVQPADTLVGLLVAPTEVDARGLNGAILWSINAVTRYEFTTQTELWGVGINAENDGSGVLTGIVRSTDNDVIVSVVSEDWAR